jgi:hypothetical protein
MLAISVIARVLAVWAAFEWCRGMRSPFAGAKA